MVVVGEKLAEITIVKGASFLLARSLPAGPELAAEIRRNLIRHSGQSPQTPVVAVYIAGKEIRIPDRAYDPRQVTDFALSNWTDLYTRARVAELRRQAPRLAAE